MAAGMVCDVKNKEHRRLLLQFATSTFTGKTTIDILVSNAAVSPYVGRTLDTPEKAFDKLFEINVKSTFFLISEAQNLMSGGGAILIVSSYLAFCPASPIGVYGVTKTALLGMTKAFSNEFAERNIRVNCIAPSVVRTNFSRMLWDSEIAQEVALSQNQLGRIAEVREVAGPAAFLCSDDASYISGETISISGGAHSRL